MYARVNVLLAQFGHCNIDIKLKLFQSYCMSLYGAMLLDYTDPSFNILNVAWRKCIRRILCVDNRTHCNLLPYIAACKPLPVVLHQRLINFLHKSMRSENTILNFCSMVGSDRGNYSLFGRNLLFLCHTYEFSEDIFSSRHPPRINATWDEDLARRGAQIASFLNYRSVCNSDDSAHITEIIDFLCLT